MSEGPYACEMWRLLDPGGHLIPEQDVAHRVVSVDQRTSEMKTVKRATGGAHGKALCVILDDRTNVWAESERAHILAVAPFMPYATSTGPGLGGEKGGEAGVLGAARRMLEVTRTKVFTAWQKFERFHRRREREGLALIDVGGARDGGTDPETAPPDGPAPPPPDVGATLPNLMAANAKDASQCITIRAIDRN